MRFHSSPVLRLAAGLAGLALLGGAASAHDSLTDFGSGWDRGAVNLNVGSGGTMTRTPVPWVRKYYSSQGACLHLEIRQVSPGANLEMLVIPPNVSQRYRDDDSGSMCTNCPRVNIDGTQKEGWYTVIVNHAEGSAASAQFVIEFTRAAQGAAACSPATAPVASPRTAKVRSLPVATGSAGDDDVE